MYLPSHSLIYTSMAQLAVNRENTIAHIPTPMHSLIVYIYNFGRYLLFSSLSVFFLFFVIFRITIFFGKPNSIRSPLQTVASPSACNKNIIFYF